MQCRFCYVPFDNARADEQTAKSVIDVVAAWGIRSITFGGGDPLIYKWGPSLIEYARHKLGSEVFVQLDTNGLLFPKGAEISRVLNSIDLLGLPIDGLTRQTCNAMRSDASHARRVLELLDVLNAYETKVKINTVVTKINIDELDRVGEEISRFGVVRMWSLYEFWAIGAIARSSKADFSIDPETYKTKVDCLKDRFPKLLRADDGAKMSRERVYFFTSHEGRCYTISGVDPSAYVELGSIFGTDLLENWLQHADEKSNRERIERRIDAVLY